MPGTPPRDVHALQVAVAPIKPSHYGQVVAPVGAQIALADSKDHERVKPYCGATTASAIRPTFGSGPGGVGTPAPAWADMALSCRMKSAVVPVSESTESGTAHLNRRFHGSRCVFRCCAVISSVLENGACFMAYGQVSNAKNELYNKFEAHVLAFDGLAFYLLILAVLNSMFLFIYWALIVIVRLDLYRLLSTFRLILSLPCGALCCLLVLFAEHTKLYPFLCCTLVLIHLEVWILHEYQIRREATGKIPKTALLGLVIIGVGIVMWTQMFSVKSVFFLRDENCPASSNVAMPVHIKEINEWHCVQWGKPKYIKREPVSQEVRDVFCSTSFRIFDEITLSGGIRPSRMAHYVRCPSQCQFLGLGNQVTGCEVYHADSSICSAAVHMGVLEPDRGGIVKVIGRVPPQTGKYDRCLRNSILSSEADFRSGRPAVTAAERSSSLLEPPSTDTEYGNLGVPQNGVAYPAKYGSTYDGTGNGEPIMPQQGPSNVGKCVCVGDRAPIPYEVYMNSTTTIATTTTTVTTTAPPTEAPTTVTTTRKPTTTTEAIQKVTVTKRVWVNATNTTNGTWKVLTETKYVKVTTTTTTAAKVGSGKASNMTNSTNKTASVVKKATTTKKATTKTTTTTPATTTTKAAKKQQKLGNASNMTNATGVGTKPAVSVTKATTTTTAAPAAATTAVATTTLAKTTSEDSEEVQTTVTSTTTLPTEPPTPEPWELCDCPVVTTTVAPNNDMSIDWAFYFQVEGMEKLDMVTLHDWKKTTSPGLNEPWKGYTANVSWVVGGTKHAKQIVLGPQDPDSLAYRDAGIELNFCAAANSSMAMECKEI